jgi:hypothetical protein
MAVHNVRRVAPVAAAVAAVMATAAPAVLASDRAAAPHHVATPFITARSAGVGPLTGKVLGGFTSQGWPIVADISTNGKRLVDARTGLSMTCSLGDDYSLLDGWRALPIPRNGKLSISVGIPPSSTGTIKLLGGSDSITGRLNRKHWTFAGRWHLHITFQDTATNQLDQCDSGAVSFNVVL